MWEKEIIQEMEPRIWYFRLYVSSTSNGKICRLKIWKSGGRRWCKPEILKCYEDQQNYANVRNNININ